MPHAPVVTFDTDVIKEGKEPDPSGKEDYPHTPPTTERSYDDVDDEGEEHHVHSQRSHASSTTSTGSRVTTGSRHLRSNLTRQHRDRDPFQVYQRVKVLGEGSMGSVGLVRKVAVGGSARINAEARAAVEDRYDDCFALPVIGGLLRWMLSSRRQSALQRAGASTRTTTSSTSTSSAERDAWHAASTTMGSTDSGDNNDDDENNNSGSYGSGSYSKQLYAMKSIHYNLISDKTFIEELSNEIAVLKTLDHPNIVRVQETFDFDKQIFVVMEVG